ncbi:hypothetical protein HMPREF0724_11080 [Prescottella equi ATCC 33707]|uniref:Uncharacterized protein n=1 Tax=Prescottella equi ATCC 33707 TaxID=525370 RepID=E9SXL5_RHOHA|nr:hypothetical protein HMPREF0724_11080 [Prescottella equi ATCC 33707]
MFVAHAAAFVEVVAGDEVEHLVRRMLAELDNVLADAFDPATEVRQSHPSPPRLMPRSTTPSEADPKPRHPLSGAAPEVLVELRFDSSYRRGIRFLRCGVAVFNGEEDVAHLFHLSDVIDQRLIE